MIKYMSRDVYPCVFTLPLKSKVYTKNKLWIILISLRYLTSDFRLRIACQDKSTGDNVLRKFQPRIILPFLPSRFFLILYNIQFIKILLWSISAPHPYDATVGVTNHVMNTNEKTKKKRSLFRSTDHLCYLNLALKLITL